MTRSWTNIKKIKAATVGSCQPLATRFCSAKEKRPIQAPQAVLNTLIQTLAKIDAGTQHLGPVMPHKRLGQFNRATVTNNQKFSCNFRVIPSITGTKRKPKIEINRADCQCYRVNIQSYNPFIYTSIVWGEQGEHTPTVAITGEAHLARWLLNDIGRFWPLWTWNSLECHLASSEIHKSSIHGGSNGKIIIKYWNKVKFSIDGGFQLGK